MPFCIKAILFILGEQMKPKVTIGVCVRNSAATLRDAIDSIIYKDYPHEHMEVIFVDDGSEDETLSIVKSYVPKWIWRLWRRF
jgi:glycosyltransferase involved in cell wall biosynthesis